MINKSVTFLVDANKNPYNAMQDVLWLLDINAANYNNHQNHFHVALRTPDLRPIDPPTQNLLADNATFGQTEAGTSEALRVAAQALLEEVQPHLGFDQGEFTMFVMDLPDMPPQYAEIVIAQAAQAQPGNTKTVRTIGVCHLLENPPDSPLTAANSLSPVASVWGYLKDQEHRTIDEAGFLAAKMTLLQAPEHGVLEMGTRGAQYHPAPDYYGPDRATFLVEIGGLKVKVMYFFQVMVHVGGNDAYDPYQDKTLCPNGVEWKISLNPDDPNGQLLTFNSPTQLTTYLAGSINVDIQIADLPSGAVGQTTGTTITLDDNAAGNGWFIDTTPGDNAEFLPTHNPNEWIAKAGSAADGKLDMLSVLLHEYGHVLGIDHSADNHDYMATTLTPGVRRLPSPDELALMAELVVGLKADLQLSSGGSITSNTPDNSPLPFPWLPLDSTLGLAFLGRLRSRLSGLGAAPDNHVG